VAKEEKRRLVLVVAVCVSLVVLVSLVFGQTIHYNFVNYDDLVYVYKNPIVSRGLTWHGLYFAFTRTVSSNWHPLTIISHMIDCQFFGVSPGGPHFVNVLLHTIAVLLLFFVLWHLMDHPGETRRRSRKRVANRAASPTDSRVRCLSGGNDSIWASAFIAALFAIHPLRVESVAWISERKDVLSGVFFMLTLGAYVRYARRPTVTRYLAVLIACALGLMAKPMLVTVPLVLLLLDYWPLKRISSQRPASGSKGGIIRREASNRFLKLLIEKIPLFVLAAASCIITLTVQARTMNQVKAAPFLVRLGNAFLSYATYIWQMFWPTKLAAFYPYAPDRTWLFIVGLIFVVAVTGAIIVARRKYPYLVTGWFWYLVMLLPVIGLVQVGLQAHADRYTYLPQIGIYLGLTLLAANVSKTWPNRSTLLGGSAAIVLGLLVWSTYQQTQYWRDSGTLWRHALAVTNDNYVAHSMLADVLQNGDEALMHLQEVVRFQPDQPDTQTHLGRLYSETGEFDKAIEHFRKTLALEPDNIDALSGLGGALIATRKAHEAAGTFEHALKIDPDSRMSLNGLAWILATSPDASLRDGQRAVQLATRGVELSRHQEPFILRTLACAYAETGQFDQAIAVARQALNLATTQSNSDLANKLRLEIDLYETNLPLRDYSLAR
jgi:protein O-mannosyl-transferase